MVSAVALPRVEILGVRVHDVTADQALDVLSAFVRSGEPHRVVTPNPEIIVQAWRDPGYRAVLNEADLAVPDGVGLLMAARLDGTRLRAHVRGTDLVLRLAERAAREAQRWFLLGGAPGVAPEAGARLSARYPGLQIAGARPGSPDPAEDFALREAIRGAGSVHVLLVAYGAPRQERWIARNQAALNVPVQMGVGGVLNFLAGRSPRAPSWLRQLELEWAYRLLTEPWRWRRQLALPAFALLATIEAVRRRSRARP